MVNNKYKKAKVSAGARKLGLLVKTIMTIIISENIILAEVRSMKVFTNLFGDFSEALRRKLWMMTLINRK
jgi:hypothetical protein